MMHATLHQNEDPPQGYKPTLASIFAGLGDIHAARYQRTGTRHDLEEAVAATRLAVSISTPDHPITPALVSNLANLLWRCYCKDIDSEDRLHQALFYALEAVNLPQAESHRATVLGTLGTVRASRYDRGGDPQDLEEAIAVMEESIETGNRCSAATRASLFNNLGALLWRRYKLTSRRKDLDESIVCLSDAVTCGPDNTEPVTSLINSGQVLALRYERTGQLDDLSHALARAQDAMQLDPKNPDLAALLDRLDRFLERRRETGGAGKVWKLLDWCIEARVSCDTRAGVWSGWDILVWSCSGGMGFCDCVLWWGFVAAGGRTARVGDIGGSGEFVPKLVAVPLIAIAQVSTLRGAAPELAMQSGSPSRRDSHKKWNLTERDAARSVECKYSGHERDFNTSPHDVKSEHQFEDIRTMYKSRGIDSETVSPQDRRDRPEIDIGLDNSTTKQRYHRQDSHTTSAPTYPDTADQYILDPPLTHRRRRGPSLRADTPSTDFVQQGDTRLKMGTNSGLAMENVSSRRAEVIGHVISQDARYRPRAYSESRIESESDPDTDETTPAEQVIESPALDMYPTHQSLSTSDTKVQSETPPSTSETLSVHSGATESVVPLDANESAEFLDRNTVLVAREEHQSVNIALDSMTEQAYVDLVDQSVQAYLASSNL
ncbi:hypothetical protein BO71DRAFT_489398 [Aspergillus ellipticus CBS 707.79]|uniref:Tetratricopeptide repeat domain protein n=1 Tax=Aspergillus ellipticus CBS 707.79 TaxID=1448320 RepID=A0A319CT17_9EURO|nr:hypothetical protein BO71DRAFT_489398 [Aspergillus ellipticus CBS 707.79]